MYARAARVSAQAAPPVIAACPRAASPPTQPVHILLVEDDLDLGRSLVNALNAAGHTAEWVRSLGTADLLIDPERHDCILLDLNLPDGHGLDLLRRWRSAGQLAPLIVITASASIDERLAGLGDGADDFLVKPFVVDELMVRIQAVTRRAARQASSTWTLGALTLDPDRRTCTLRGEPVALSPREFDVVLALARSQGRVLAKHRLAQALVPLGDPLDYNALEVHVHNLRRKLGPGWIRTVRGVGYLLEDGSGVETGSR